MLIIRNLKAFVISITVKKNSMHMQKDIPDMGFFCFIDFRLSDSRGQKAFFIDRTSKNFLTSWVYSYKLNVSL